MKIVYSLPDQIIANDTLPRRFPEWSADKMFAKTGVRLRHVARDGDVKWPRHYAELIAMCSGTFLTLIHRDA